MAIRVADPKLQLALIDEVQRVRFGYSWVERHRQAYDALGAPRAWDELMSGLREFHACALCGLRDISALLELAALRRFSVVNIASSPTEACARAGGRSRPLVA